MSGGIPYWHVDAFSAQPFGGNPAAVMVLDDRLPDAVMQQIAAEFGLPATAFLSPDESGGGDWEVRWYSPAREIALCGHASLACGHVLFGSLERGDARDSIALRSRNSGILDLRRTEAAYELSLPAIKIEPSQLDEAVAALGGGPEEVFRSDLGYNIFVFAQEAQVRGLTPDFARLAALGDDQFICTAPGEASDIVSRVFVPGGGANEDSVTGSAHAALASYWTPRVGRERLTAYQASPRGGHLALRVGQDRVWLGGPCVTFGEGRFYL